MGDSTVFGRFCEEVRAGLGVAQRSGDARRLRETLQTPDATPQGGRPEPRPLLFGDGWLAGAAFAGDRLAHFPPEE